MGRVRGRFEDHDIAGDQGRHHLPTRNRHREIPGRDDPGDPKGLANAHRPLVGELRRHRLAGHPPPFAGHQVGDVDPFLDVAAGLRQDLAHLAGHCASEALLLLGHQRPERVQNLAALGRRRASPHRAGRPGGTDGHRHVRRGPLLEPADHVSRIGRVVAGERGAGRGIAPLPGDEVMEFLRSYGYVSHDHLAGNRQLRSRYPRRPLRALPARTLLQPNLRRRGTTWLGHSGPRDDRARAAMWPRSAPLRPRSGAPAQSRRR